MKLQQPPLRSPILDGVGNFLQSWVMWFNNIYAMFINKVWTPAFTGLTVVGSVTTTAQYVIVGNMLFWDVVITPVGAGTVASSGAAYINNLPVPTSNPSGVLDANGAQFAFDAVSGTSFGQGLVVNATTNAIIPAFSATNHAVALVGSVRVH